MRFRLLLPLLVLFAASNAVAESLAMRVERAATEVARSAVSSPDRFEVIAARFVGASPVDGDTQLSVVKTTGPNTSGIVQVVFRMTVEGVARGEARASVRGRVLGPALRAASTLKKGEVLSPLHVESAESDLTRLTEPPLREASQAQGFVPVRTLAQGRVLTASMLAAAPVVHRGQTVDLRVDRGGLNIVMSARALRDAVPGEVVAFENIASGATVHGRVLPDGTAFLVRR